MELHWDPIPLATIEASRERTRGVAVRTPLARLDADDLLPAGTEVWLKLESLQPVRSFKLRGAYNLMAKLGRAALSDGVWTASSGNMAQAVAWAARRLGAPATVYVPDIVPRSKLASIRRYGAAVVELPVDEIESIFKERGRDGAPGVFVHPYSDPEMMAGSGVIGLEILEDLPEVDVVIAPYGGGGLIGGLGSALRELKPRVRIYTSESAAGAPFAPSLAAGRPVEVALTPGLADGIEATFVNVEMFELARRLVDESIVVTHAEIAAAIRLVVERNRVVPEGAAATAVASALSGRAGAGRIVCVVSGGNIDAAKLAGVLGGSDG